MRADVIDQVMAIALHPVYDCKTAIVSVYVIMNLTQSLEAHPHIVRTKLIEDMLEMCALKHSEQSPQSQTEKEDPMAVKALL